MTLLIRENIFTEQATKFYISEMILAINNIHVHKYMHRYLARRRPPSQ